MWASLFQYLPRGHMNWLTSDTHFNHANVVRYCGRPFGDVREMNEALIARWNERVSRDDTVFHLGDFAMGSPDGWPAIASRLNGRKMLVLGNHDRHRGKMLSVGFDEVLGKNVVVSIDGLQVWLNHYPPHGEGAVGLRRPPAPAEYDLALCGHVHQLWKVRDGVINVGVDVWNFTPTSIREILSFLADDITLQGVATLENR